MLDISNILFLLVGAIFLFAIFDLIVWVSNDAINFLSPSVGSKVASYKVIIIIASLWILFGALFSSWMMEVARKWIFHPQHFTFLEITILFLSVIVADILLLDRFNSLGMPTSTTVSIVFCLLWGAVWVWVIKVIQADLSMEVLSTYINTAKVLTIILWILWSVVASFLLWSIVQYIARLFFTFNYQNKPKYWAAILLAIAITAITHFILVKGMKGSVITWYAGTIDWVKHNLILFLAIAFIIWFLILNLLLTLKVNVFKLIVLVWTFSLAMAFAGNDLVNFIWVPLAALKSYTLFAADTTITDPSLFFMDGLNKKEKANIFLLIIGGAIMVLTIVFSKKAKIVLDTGLALARQNDGKENFWASYLSKAIVRNFIRGLKILKTIVPKKIWEYIGGRFNTVESSTNKNDTHFDFIRASVILICSSILISIATSYKLPLSTTYVTFMVAMWAAFADRSWGRESAVYRVNWVVTVITGWFLTAFWAFTFAFLIANIIYFWGSIAAIWAILLVLYIMLKPAFFKKSNLDDATVNAELNDSKDDTKGFLEWIKKNLTLWNEYYGKVLDNLSEEGVSKAKKLHKEISSYKEDVYSFKKDLLLNIWDIDEKDVKSLSTHVGILNSMKNYSKSLRFISESVTEHIDNNHVFSKLECKSLATLNAKISAIHTFLIESIDKNDFNKEFNILTELRENLNKYIEEDIQRVRDEKVDIGSSTLYIWIINETKYLLIEIGAIYRRCWELDKRS